MLGAKCGGEYSRDAGSIAGRWELSVKESIAGMLGQSRQHGERSRQHRDAGYHMHGTGGGGGGDIGGPQRLRRP